MGSGSDNAVDLGDANHAARGLGDVDITTTGTPPGSTSLMVGAGSPAEPGGGGAGGTGRSG
jgi:hypothetical protein